MNWSNDQWFQVWIRKEAVNYYHKALHLGCCSSPRSASEKRSKRKKKISTKVFYVNGFMLLRVIPSVLLVASFQLRSLSSSHKLIAIHIFYLNILIFENYPRTVSRNVKLSNLENVLQRNLRTSRTRECSFRAFSRHRFWNFSYLPVSQKNPGNFSEVIHTYTKTATESCRFFK